MQTLQIILLLAIAAIYAIFDVFNKRNVPDWFAYGSVAAGVAAALLFNPGTLTLTFLLALAIGIVGYAIYRLGYWGAGDYFELVAISLILPLQPQPLFTSLNQFGMPFIFSVVIATGMAALWGVPLYYLFISKNRKKGFVKVDSSHVAKGITALSLYVILLALTLYLFGLSYRALALILLLAIPSSISMTFEETIRSRMVEYVLSNRLEVGDMIATSLISEGELQKLKKRYKDFGRLVTKPTITSLRNWKKPLPVYKEAAPLAPFVLLGVIIAFLFGNLMLFLVWL